LFGAVDLFSPFAPLEADREWRRGIDAVHVDVPLGDRTSIDGVAAFGRDIEHAAFAGRFRGYAGKADVELIGGRRARDTFGGLTTSAAVGDAEVHGELAVFRTPAVSGSLAFADERSIVKAVVGASYRLPIGNGLLAYGEYHYSGFGASAASGILPLLADQEFQERRLRGDTQILARHAVAVLASYEVTWTVNDTWSMVLSGYLPFGREAVGLGLGSQFGSSPLAAFVQIRAYR
jgi:hypothetical protein